MNAKTNILPLLPLRGITVFPGMILNFDVERKMSVSALNKALSEDQMIYLVAQKEISTESPDESDLFEYGTVCVVKQVLRAPNGKTVKVMVEGISRAKTISIIDTVPHFVAEYCLVEDEPLKKISPRTELSVRHCIALFDEYANISGVVSSGTLLGIIDCQDPGHVADYVAQSVFLKHTEKQLVLEELRPVKRIELVNRLLTREINIISLDHKIGDKTKKRMDKAQRDYYLHEQMKVIQNELGEGSDNGFEEFDEYREKISALKLDKETETKLMKEVSRLSKQPFGSSEAALIRAYLDICIELPWNIRTKDTIDIAKARKCLDQDHYGLEKVKERIIEFLAVKKLAPDMKGGVLCLVGPPGVGKTSIAMSIARATGRKLSRISLGGVHDEAEIRGHRKTYIGAMPGRIIAGIQQAKSMNPVMVLDEIDKISSNIHGDPAAALLEALDGEQNGAFRDNYLEIPMDLSDVLFVTTANTLSTVPRALLDRMEVIELGSYTDEEKVHIAKNYLIPKQRKKHGLNGNTLKISDDAVREIISEYTRESGVRKLERNIAAVCRKTAAVIASGEKKSVSVKSGELEKYLGTPVFTKDKLYAADEVGLVRGLAWTQVGGEVLDVEVGVMDGSGKIELTGNLGDIMKESARAAISYIRTRCDVLGIDNEFYKNKDIHIHFPEGAVSKDGPSAGITMCIGLISALTGIPVRRDIAMTGEISLRGRIMAIGGLKEKTMAAFRTGIRTVIIPADNVKDLQDIDPDVRAALNFVSTDHVDKILDIALSKKMVKKEDLLEEVSDDSTVIPEKFEPTNIRIGQ